MLTFHFVFVIVPTLGVIIGSATGGHENKHSADVWNEVGYMSFLYVERIIERERPLGIVALSLSNVFLALLCLVLLCQ